MFQSTEASTLGFEPNRVPCVSLVSQIPDILGSSGISNLKLFHCLCVYGNLDIGCVSDEFRREDKWVERILSANAVDCGNFALGVETRYVSSFLGMHTMRKVLCIHHI